MKNPWTIFLALTLLLAACGTPPAVPSATVTASSENPTPLPTVTLTPAPTDTTLPTLVPIPTLGIGSLAISSVDGMVLVYVPAGSFEMGSGDNVDEMPPHPVTLDAFWIDKTEVTNGEYAKCVAAKACQPPRRITSNLKDLYYGNSRYADFPVIWMNWSTAQAYCHWAGRRLPTEAEWEKAARDTDGRTYPWGNNPPDKTLLNFNEVIKDVTQTGSYPVGASPYGALDMAGNVWEWAADWYAVDTYAKSLDHNPLGPHLGTLRILRGGSFRYNARGVTTTYRFSKDPTFSSDETGFRCALSSNP
jgi:serine/threonine-protein kinase